jgi:hypothetical protein
LVTIYCIAIYCNIFIDEGFARTCKRLLRDKGYVLVNEPVVSGDNDSLITSLGRSIEELHQRDFPATFILLFDETWDLAQRSRALLEKARTSN